jgi:hypothetical protein
MPLRSLSHGSCSSAHRVAARPGCASTKASRPHRQRSIYPHSRGRQLPTGDRAPRGLPPVRDGPKRPSRGEAPEHQRITVWRSGAGPRHPSQKQKKRPRPGSALAAAVLPDRGRSDHASANPCLRTAFGGAPLPIPAHTTPGLGVPTDLSHAPAARAGFFRSTSGPHRCASFRIRLHRARPVNAPPLGPRTAHTRHGPLTSPPRPSPA